MTTSRPWLGISPPLWLKVSDAPQALVPAVALLLLWELGKLIARRRMAVTALPG